MSGKYIVIPASYETYPGQRHKGNPFVETLLKFDLGTSSAIKQGVSALPSKPTAAARRLPSHIRKKELNDLKECVFARTEYMRIAPLLMSSIQEAYYSRNPMTQEDSARRHAIADKRFDGRLPWSWKSHAEGMTLTGVSGGGKTTFLDLVLLPLTVVIEHKTYNGQPLNCRQLVILRLQIPFNGTVRSLLLQFFENVDAAMGTEFSREAGGVGGLAEMELLITKVATAVSLGLVAIDEVQNLRAAGGPQIEHVLNLFVKILEDAGVSVLIAATPAVQRLMESNVRNLRKLTTGFDSQLNCMQWGSKELNAFQDEIWPYQHTAHISRLTPDLRRSWYEAGAGNPAFMVSSFMFAQKIEIGTRERIDEVSFVRASQRFMSSLQPAIRALKSGRLEDLEVFEDLMFSSQADPLRGAIGWSSAAPSVARDQEPDFPEIQTAIEENESEQRKRAPKESKSGGGKPAPVWKPDFPLVDPLSLN